MFLLKNGKISLIAVALWYFLLITNCYSQSFMVKGKVLTSSEPVKSVSVKFIDQNDTTRKYTALTDTLGNYKLDIITSVKQNKNLPAKYELEQNYPNPFSIHTLIQYKLHQQSNISIKIFNILGQIIKDFRLTTQNEGLHKIVWDGTDMLGNKVPIGIYFYQLTTDNITETKKMMFGFSNDYIGGKPFESYSYENVPLTKSSKNPLQGSTFKIRIENSTNSDPKILSEEFPDVIIRQDTTLNFQVQLGIMAYSLCYEKTVSSIIDGKLQRNWEICLNNIMGTNYKDITNWPYDDEDPDWSPDGNYITFWHTKENGDADIYLYNTKRDTCMGLLTSSTTLTYLPQWTPDSKKIFYLYHVIPNPVEYHIVNIDGTNDHKLEYLPESSNSYFYSDSYTIFYSDENSKVYKTNIDNTYNDLILDLRLFGGSVIEGFNSNTEEILFRGISNGLNAIYSYNINTKNIQVLFKEDSTYDFVKMSWSNDFTKIAFVETNNGPTRDVHHEYLSILQDGIKRRLMHIAGNDTAGGFLTFGYYPLRFSPDDKYIAYGTLFTKDGIYIGLYKYLFVVEIATGYVQYIDSGEAYKWNPVR